jgi:hypothetical protein
MKTKRKSNIFQVSDKYRLDSDKLNIILQEKQIVTGNGQKKLTVSQVGDIHWINVAYFSTPKSALEYIILKEIKDSWVTDLKEVVKKIDELTKLINGIKGLPELPKRHETH